ncbi:PDZ domain-containing protein [Sphingomonas gilva]|uniref:PDZ domain-containing protein n=1 Tax=Sphingomonas gilva TaxID=2305907 RepID=A0A396RKZ0_9SPHN|nr:type II secretion system protein N [Sphingomonas gilva]RHW16957.1 PDZ domain-containing protein [Sphingomonas gilva]
MRLELDGRLRRLVRLVRPITIYRASELAMMALVALLAARLVWAVLTPVTPIGDWARGQIVQPANLSRFAGFDPFFRNQPAAGEAVVTSLQLVLFGIRMNEASGGGSAIIEVPGEGQQSFAVGDEIMPGVTLKAVAWDHVVIARGGADEQLYVAQGGSGDAAPAPAADIASAPSVATIAGAVTATPRSENGLVTGVTIQPGGDAAAFAATGLQAGDVLLRVNGERVRALEDIATAVAANAGEGPVQMDIERGGQRITISREFQP